MPDNLYCDQTTPWQGLGVYFFTNTADLEHKMCLTICIVTKLHLGKMCIFLPKLFIGNSKMIHYICVIPILLCWYHTSPWTQSWIQAFIVAYEKLTFKSVKQNLNCCFRNQPWARDAVKSRQALKKGCIKSTNQNAIFFARIYQTLI